MKLFNKEQIYTIITEESANLKSQRFADEHSVKNSIIDVCLIDGSYVIRFTSNEKREDIFKSLKSIFEQNFDLGIDGNTLYIADKL